MIIVFCSWQDGGSSVWGRIQGFRLRLGQTHRHGKSMSDLSRFVTLSPLQSCRGLWEAVVFIFDISHTGFENVCVCVPTTTGCWVDSVGSRSVLCQECHGSGRALHRGSSGQTVTGPRDLQVNSCRGCQTPNQGQTKSTCSCFYCYVINKNPTHIIYTRMIHVHNTEALDVNKCSLHMDYLIS